MTTPPVNLAPLVDELRLLRQQVTRVADALTTTGIHGPAGVGLADVTALDATAAELSALVDLAGNHWGLVRPTTAHVPASTGPDPVGASHPTLGVVPASRLRVGHQVACVGTLATVTAVRHADNGTLLADLTHPDGDTLTVRMSPGDVLTITAQPTSLEEQ